jgi:hypothetical protein
MQCTQSPLSFIWKRNLDPYRKGQKATDSSRDEIFQKNSRCNLFDHKRNLKILEEMRVEQFEEKIRRWKSNRLRHVTRMNKNRMLKIMLNYRPNGRRRFGRPLKRLSDAAGTRLSRPNSWRIIIIIIVVVIINTVSPDFSWIYRGDVCPQYDMNFDLLSGISLLLKITYLAQEDLPDTLHFNPPFFLKEDKVYIIYTLCNNQMHTISTPTNAL